MTLEALALDWIAPYWNGEHLVRTRDWLLVLEPGAGEALRLAALTHDIERHFPGGPVQDLSVSPGDDDEYRRLHAERSAEIVGEWLRAQGAAEGLVTDVKRLVCAHETGGAPDEDLVQAADSLSFLEVNAPVLAGWVERGRCGADRAKAQARWMLDRIRIGRARPLARPLYERTVAAIDEVSARS